ncbi:MAG TPA: hypothetical protein GX717_00230, partial [Clostridiaceae bacterium]|nr:hypothetical protein [Clostridiaceae bacterium]
MASKTTGKLNLWLTKMTDKISDTISTYLYENFTKIDTEFSAHLAETTTKFNVIEDEIDDLTSGKADKVEVRMKDVKLELEDMSPTTLAAIEGGEETSFDLLSIPQDMSVNRNKLDLELGKSLISSLNNEVPDAELEGDSWYTTAGSSVDFSQGVLVATGNGTRPSFGTSKPISDGQFDNPIRKNDKIYYGSTASIDSDLASNFILSFQNINGTVSLQATTLTSPLPNTYYKLSNIVEVTEDMAGCNLLLTVGFASSGDALDKVMKMHSPILINLTKVFGAGNEPSKEEMDEFMESIGWYPKTAPIDTITLTALKGITKLRQKQVENSSRIDDLAQIVSEKSGLKRYVLKNNPLPELMDVSDLGWTIDGSQVIEPYWVENHNDSVRIIGYWNSQLFQSLDNGATWTRIMAGGLLNGRPAYVFCTPHPDFNKSVFVVTRNTYEIYQSSDLENDGWGSWIK